MVNLVHNFHQEDFYFLRTTICVGHDDNSPTGRPDGWHTTMVPPVQARHGTTTLLQQQQQAIVSKVEVVDKQGSASEHGTNIPQHFTFHLLVSTLLIRSEQGRYPS